MTENEGTVYLVQNPPPVRRASGPPIFKDLSSAQRYGVLHPMLDEGEQPSATPGPCLHKVSKALRQFNPERDFLCYAGGDPMSLAIGCLALANMGIKEFNLLRWERERSTDGQRQRGGFYVPVNVQTRL